MSETLPGKRELPPTPPYKIDEEDVLIDPSKAASYHRERKLLAAEGLTVWEVWGIDNAEQRKLGMVHWLNVWGEKQGKVYGDSVTKFDTYRQATPDELATDGVRWKLLNIIERFDTPEQAKRALEDYVLETSLE